MTCQPGDAVSVYPTAAALGASADISLSTPLPECGRLSVITFLSSRLGGKARPLARAALHALAVKCRLAPAGCREFI